LLLAVVAIDTLLIIAAAALKDIYQRTTVNQYNIYSGKKYIIERVVF
jgi:hypothetical protein